MSTLATEHTGGRLPGSGVASAVRAGFDVLPPPGLILAGIVCVQLGAGLAKELFADLTPGSVVAVRLATSAVALLLIARPRIAGRSRSDIALLVAFGVVLAVMNFSFYQAIARVPLGVVVTVEFLGPLTVAIAGSRRRLDLLWVLLAAGGVLLLSGGGQHLSMAGIGLALLAAACWGSYILLSAATGRRFEGTTGLTFAMCLAAVLTAPIGVAHGAGSIAARPVLLLVGAGVGILASVIPYILEMEALRRVPARTFGILMSLEPAVGALIGLLVLGELLGVGQWLAIGLVVAASAGSTWTARPPGAGAGRPSAEV